MDSLLSPIENVRAFERAVEQIANNIRLGDFVEGEKLPSERELAAALNISRPSLREAIHVLQEAGVLEVRPGSAGGIRVISSNLPRELLRSSVDLRIDEVRSVLEARRLFEPRVAQLAAVHAVEEDFQRMQATIDRQIDILEAGTLDSDRDEFVVCDVHFHLRMAAATHNPTVVEFARILQGKLEFAREAVIHTPENPEWVIDIHERTRQSIRRGDHDEIQEVMEEHVRGLEVAWEHSTSSSLVRKLPDFLIPG